MQYSWAKNSPTESIGDRKREALIQNKEGPLHELHVNPRKRHQRI